jgi:hypothetical protein
VRGERRWLWERRAAGERREKAVGEKGRGGRGSSGEEGRIDAHSTYQRRLLLKLIQ